MTVEMAPGPAMIGIPSGTTDGSARRASSSETSLSVLDGTNRHEREENSASDLESRHGDAEKREDRSSRHCEDRQDRGGGQAGPQRHAPALPRSPFRQRDEDRRGRDRIDHREDRREGEQRELRRRRRRHG
jgi:hypothetical protein